MAVRPPAPQPEAQNWVTLRGATAPDVDAKLPVQPKAPTILTQSKVNLEPRSLGILRSTSPNRAQVASTFTRADVQKQENPRSIPKPAAAMPRKTMQLSRPKSRCHSPTAEPGVLSRKPGHKSAHPKTGTKSQASSNVRKSGKQSAGAKSGGTTAMTAEVGTAAALTSTAIPPAAGTTALTSAAEPRALTSGAKIAAHPLAVGTTANTTMQPADIMATEEQDDEESSSSSYEEEFKIPDTKDLPQPPPDDWASALRMICTLFLACTLLSIILSLATIQQYVLNAKTSTTVVTTIR